MRDWIFVRDRIARIQRAQRQNRGTLCEARACCRRAVVDSRRRKRRKNQRFSLSRRTTTRRGLRRIEEDGNFDRRRFAKNIFQRKNDSASVGLRGEEFSRAMRNSPSLLHLSAKPKFLFEVCALKPHHYK